jgi:DNA-binding response OmpR family regulator
MDHPYQDKLILMVEDNPSVLRLNQKVMETNRFTVKAASTLFEAEEILEKNAVDLILLDILMPDGSGLDFCRTIRQYTNAPILMLSSLRTSQDVISGLLTGGDDYMTKPYKVDELVARIISLLRREELSGRSARQTVITCENLKLDTVSLRAYVDGNDLQLTPKEFALLLYMVKNKDSIVSVEQIYQNVWNLTPNRDTRLLWTHFSKIRSKLEKHGTNPFDISAVKGRGYIFTVIG